MDEVIRPLVISNLIEVKNNSNYLIGCLDKVIRPLVSILPKVNGYVKTFKEKNNNVFVYRWWKAIRKV